VNWIDPLAVGEILFLLYLTGLLTGFWWMRSKPARLLLGLAGAVLVGAIIVLALPDPPCNSPIGFCSQNFFYALFAVIGSATLVALAALVEGGVRLRHRFKAGLE